MARTVTQAGVVVRAFFEVYDTNNDPVTGLVNGDFTKLLSRLGLDDATSVTVSETGSGRYYAQFTPATTGEWHLVVRHATYNKRGWHETWDVTVSGRPDLDEWLDSASEIDGYSIRNVLRFVGAACAGKTSGQKTAPVFRALNDSRDRITATVDASGNRTAVTLDTV